MLFRSHPAKDSKSIQFYVYLANAGWSSVSFTPLEGFDLTQWHQYAATYDGKDLVLYIDGTECARQACSGKIQNAIQELYIGHDPVQENKRYFKGQLAHACLWQKALSAAEIQIYYERPPVGTEEADLWAYFPLNRFSTGKIGRAHV